MNLDAFARDLTALGQQLREESGPADLAHYRKIARWGRIASVVGYATAWIAPNPISVIGISTGRFARWTMVGHHVCHRGYDRIGGPKGKTFAEGGRRLLDWFDWMLPAAWKHEHNVLHHYRLNEPRDPDLVEDNLDFLRESRAPRWAKIAFVALGTLIWKWAYYAPNTLGELHRAADEGDEADEADGLPRNTRAWNPLSPVGHDLWFKSLLPFAGVHFVLLPALALLISPWAALSVLVNGVLAELLTNAHGFLVVVPNHAGDDLYRFDGAPKGKADFYLRQVAGSVNFRTGGDLNDFLHGFLNYQIEHHLWPDMPMAALQRAQPRVKAICEKHGVPYVQESVWRRLVKTVQIMIGDTSMKVWHGAVATTSADEAVVEGAA